LQRILVGIDGSDHAMKAVDKAAAIAAAFNADLHLLVVATPVPSVLEMLELYQQRSISWRNCRDF
jgi:nucleotide-binding universal stress UspA family protein